MERCALGGSAAPAADWVPAPITSPPPALPATPSPTLLGDLAADFATALVIEPIVPEPFGPAVGRTPDVPAFAEVVPFAARLEVDTQPAALPECAPEIVDRAPEVVSGAPESFRTEWDALDGVQEPQAAAELPAAVQPTTVDVADDVGFLSAEAAEDAVSTPGAPATARGTGPEHGAPLPWLDLEGPVRDWERADYVPPAPRVRPRRARAPGPAATWPRPP